MTFKLAQYRNQICLVIALLIAGMVTGGILRMQHMEDKLKQTQEHLAQEVLRFHVLANSDSEADQALKMNVKAAVLDYMKAQMPNSDSLEETRRWVDSHLAELREVALEQIAAKNYDYDVKLKVQQCYFPDKTYGDVTFPAGDYEALRIEIGAAKGQNWWCVLYPNLCFTDATNAVVPEEGKEELQEVLDEEEYEMVTATSEFKIKWYFFGEEENK